MKNIAKPILILVLSAAVVAGAYFAYNALSEKTPEDTSQTTVTSDGSGVTAETEKSSLKAAADIIVYTADGEKVSLSSFKGKGVVLNFWASWCSPCRSEMPHFQSMYEKYGDKVAFVMVNLGKSSNDSKQSALNLINNGGYTFPVYFDSDYGNAADIYSVYSIPQSVFINAEGEIVKTFTGAMNAERLEAAIELIK